MVLIEMQKGSITPAQKKIWDLKAARAVIAENVPLSYTESGPFRDLLTSLQPAYKPAPLSL